MRAVVIGTGAGGLTSAAYLARAGFDVLALEQAKQIGGFINPFARRHFEFDPGVHYMGEAHVGGTVHKALAPLDIDAAELFAPMDPDFDRIRFPDFEFRICAGIDAYRDRLAETFPSEVRGIDRFFGVLGDLARVATAGTELVATGPRPRHLKAVASATGLARWVRASFASMLDWAFDGPEIKAVVAGQCGDYGLPPSRASALYALALIRHYADGAYFPRGGSRSLRDAILERATDAGARFERFTRVTEIVVEDGSATGVRTDKGDFHPADVVVAAVDPAVTFGELIAPEHLPKKLVRRATSLEPSVGSFCVFLGMNRNLREHGLGAFNIWDYPTWNIESVYEPVRAGRIPEEFMFFLSPNSLKDPTGALAPDGSSTLEIVTLLPHGPFAPWDGGRALKRPDDYVAFKEEVADGLLAAVERRHPGLVGDVVVKEIGTPVTNSYYTLAVEGGAYGPAATPSQSILFRFPTKTPVRNVLLAGAGVLGGGVAPCLQSGAMAAAMARKLRA